jgi:DNA polymerase III alpha subunit
MTPDWNLLKRKDIVQQLPHIHNYYDDLQKFQVGNIHELAAFLAIIRPGKSYLRKKPKDMAMKEVWKKSKNENAYFFKKSHAYAYALMIVVKMNLLSLKEKN